MKKFALFALFASCFLSMSPLFAQQTVPEIRFDSVPDYPKLPPGINFGEVPGVAVNSKGHVFVFTRSNTAGGPAYGPAAGQLLEFGRKANSCARSAKARMRGRRRTASGSTKRTTSGPSIKVRT